MGAASANESQATGTGCGMKYFRGFFSGKPVGDSMRCAGRFAVSMAGKLHIIRAQRYGT